MSNITSTSRPYRYELRLSREEKRALDTLAHAYNLTISGTIRKLVQDEHGRSDEATRLKLSLLSALREWGMEKNGEGKV